ncbi:YciI family protein [Haliangium sp.]|uniref:YciI family protein n=1 Tax=Haliangium sp. TaxID=2663208 RepID=UPI003D0B6ED7
MTAKATYALLIYRTAPHEPAPADSAQVLAHHKALQQEAAGRGDLHAVARLDDAVRAKTVRAHAGVHDVTDGPYIDTKEWLVGFYVVDCADEEEALARARSICPIEDHAIEVRPVTWRWCP